MSNLQKFNQTLDEFNQEVNNLKDVSAAYRKLQHLTETYSVIIKEFEDSVETLNDINELHRALQERVSGSLAELKNINKQTKIELTKLFEEKTDVIRKDNKDFYRDLEDTIKIKLDENRSQIKQLIESERSQIKQIFEIEFVKNTKELKKSIDIEMDKQTQLLVKNQNALKILLWIIGGLTMVLSTVTAFKLWLM